MNVSDTFDYLIRLQREGFTGCVRLEFHKGKVSKKSKKETTAKKRRS